MGYVNELGPSGFETWCAGLWLTRVDWQSGTQFKKLAGPRWIPLDISVTHAIM